MNDVIFGMCKLWASWGNDYEWVLCDTCKLNYNYNLQLFAGDIAPVVKVPAAPLRIEMRNTKREPSSII